MSDHTWKDKNILKISNDYQPCFYDITSDVDDIFKFTSIDKDIGEKKLVDMRKSIEPWLTALFQSEHFSLLVGAGFSYAIKELITSDASTSTPMEKTSFTVLGDIINEGAIKSAKLTGRIEKESKDAKVNIEDQIRVANEIFNGLKHFSEEFYSEHFTNMPKAEEIEKEINTVLEYFITGILNDESLLDTAKSNKEVFDYLVDFLVSFASRSGTRERLNLFTTNYDRILEIGADVAGIRFLDRFVGNLVPVFRSSRLNIDMHYNPPGIRGEPRFLEGVVHYTKLHGSIDWIYQNDYVRKVAIPFGANNLEDYLPKSNDICDAKSVMIYPNSAKDRETSEYPYIELFRDFSGVVCQPNSTLVTYGYSFGDEHINRMIKDMLVIPSTHLVIIAYGDNDGKVKRFYDLVHKEAQITLLIGNHFGDLKNIVDFYLPKPAIDKNTIRMADLLRARGFNSNNQPDEEKQKKEDSETK